MTAQMSLFGPAVPEKPRKPALRFYGSKWSLAEWIVSHFPHGFENMSYVEPYGGGAGVLLWKPPSFLETYNDLDSRLVGFFRVLRDREEELIHALLRTPFAREEYYLSRNESENEVETARRTFVSLWQSIGGTPGRLAGWRIQRRRDARYSASSREYILAIENLELIARRLQGVQIENSPALELIRLSDSPETLFYVDPPYPQMTRASKGKSYSHEFTPGDHDELAQTLAEIQGFALVSSYPSELYDRLYRGWQRVDRESRINSGGSAVESLYLSPRLGAELG